MARFMFQTLWRRELMMSEWPCLIRGLESQLCALPLRAAIRTAGIASVHSRSHHHSDPFHKDRDQFACSLILQGYPVRYQIAGRSGRVPKRCSGKFVAARAVEGSA